MVEQGPEPKPSARRRANVDDLPLGRMTDRAQKVLELSLREALQLGHNYIGTEHILLGLLREGEGVGAKALSEFTDLSEIRKVVVRLLSGYSKPVPDQRRAGGDWDLVRELRVVVDLYESAARAARNAADRIEELLTLTPEVDRR